MTPTNPDLAFNDLLGDLRLVGEADAERRDGLKALAQRMLQSGVAPGAPPRETLVRLGDRWSSLLLFVLSTGRYRYAELRRVINALCRMAHETPVSQRMLTLRLRVLERDGLVARNVSGAKVPTVDYRLTPLGEGLMEHLWALIRWTEQNGDRMLAAQRDFDARAEAPADGVVVHRMARKVSDSARR